jgi:hypothetical protein
MEAETSLDRKPTSPAAPVRPLPMPNGMSASKIPGRCVTEPEGSESEFGRQIPVDLEANADLNEGHRSLSRAVSIIGA